MRAGVSSPNNPQFCPYLGDEKDPVPQVEGIAHPSTRYAEVGYLPELSLRVTNDVVDHGTPVYGEIVLFPRRKISSNRLRLRIVSRQSARMSVPWTPLNSLVGRRSLLTKRYKDKILRITEEKSFPKSTRVTLPFCIEFPTWSDHTQCTCQEQFPSSKNESAPRHEFLPPSHGIHSSLVARSNPVSGNTVSYHLEAVVDGTDLIADCPLNFRPSSFLMSVDTALDADSEAVKRTYTSMLTIGSFSGGSTAGSLSKSLSSSFRRKSTTNISFSANMHYHDIANREGLIWVVCSNPDAVVETVEKITYYVHKNSHACPTGKIHDSATTVTTYVIAAGKSIEHTPLAEGTTSIAVSFAMARNKNLKIVPSYISCITAVTYQLELIIKCTSHQYRLKIPLVCASNLSSFKLEDNPDTASNADLHFMPEECPSLIDDESCVWDLDSNADTIFTME